jgi:glycosyltransferase involved in cell wall biosynthesis
MVSALEVWALAGQGGAPSLFQTLLGYSRRGHELHFVAPEVGANHHYGAPVLTPPPIDGVVYHRLHLPSLAESRLPRPELALKADQKLRFALLFPWLAARRAADVLAHQRFDLLYGYEVHGVLAQRLVRRRRPLPLVARFQGTVMRPYLGSRVALLRKYEEVLALRTPADLYIMTDDGTQGDEVLERLNPRSHGKLRFWRNGLDLGAVRAPSAGEAVAARAELGLRDDELTLVTASRLARWKRVDRALDAVALLRGQGVPARLLVVGDGEERGNLEAQARSLGLGESVRFVGAVPQAEVKCFLWAADVFLSLSELSNAGNPLLEAMLSARCILTLDEGDTRDLIRDGETGVLLPDGNPETIARALAELAASPARREQLAAGAQQAARGFWSWEQRLDAEVDEVETVAGIRARPPAVDV